MPPGPVVVHIVAPVFKPGRNIAAAANGIQHPGGLQQGFLPGTLTDDDQALLAAVHVHVEVVFCNVCQIESGAVVVDQFVAVVTEELLIVVQAGNSETGVEQVGAAVVQVAACMAPMEAPKVMISSRPLM